ncbi:MAG: U32 family peptidase C-terminal domain-containing protein [Erysipelotrichales bacterium]|nr:U32 family peptidase C-terminal domain-containing protein [Erysipelotrichales bacterium]
MKKVELLAPAGDLDRLKLALIYGADAVYIGGKEMSLRSHASNFTIDDIKEGVQFAHSLNKKVYVTCNMVMHNEDKRNALTYLKELKKCNVDGIITSSLDLINLNNQYVGNEMHLSTQLSTLNLEAIEFYKNYKVTRAVLGRECSLKEIKDICLNTPLEIEVFIHGGMCSSYSGKCMLSNVMTLRDANRGGCAHSCRWKYYLYDGVKKINKKQEYFAMSSKDLCALKEIPALIKSGVASLKIEGRMKSANYLCAIVSAYRKCIDDYYSGKRMNYKYYYDLMSYGENRVTGHGFLHGEVTTNEQLFALNDEFKNAGDFIGIVRSFDPIDRIASVEIKNKIISKTEYVKLSAEEKPKKFKIKKMYFNDNEVNVFTVANKIVQIETKETFKPYDIIHAVK